MRPFVSYSETGAERTKRTKIMTMFTYYGIISMFEIFKFRNPYNPLRGFRD